MHIYGRTLYIDSVVIDLSPIHSFLTVVAYIVFFLAALMAICMFIRFLFNLDSEEHKMEKKQREIDIKERERLVRAAIKFQQMISQ